MIAEGLNGRTATIDSPIAEGRNGLPYLLPCLHSHLPVDSLVIYLGTNDVYHFGLPSAWPGGRAAASGARDRRPGRTALLRTCSSSARRRSTGTRSGRSQGLRPSSTASCSTSTASRLPDLNDDVPSRRGRPGGDCVGRRRAHAPHVSREPPLHDAAADQPLGHRRARAASASTRSRATCRTSRPTTARRGLRPDAHVWVVRRTVLDVQQPFARRHDESSCDLVQRRRRLRGRPPHSVAGDRGGRVEAEMHLDPPRPRPAAASASTSDSSRSTARRPRAGGRRRGSRCPRPPPARRRAWSLRATDIDRLGHVNNAAYWVAVEEQLGRTLAVRIAPRSSTGSRSTSAIRSSSSRAATRSGSSSAATCGPPRRYDATP